MEERNIFSAKFVNKSTAELEDIIAGDSHIEEAKIAAKLEIESRSLQEGEIVIYKNDSVEPSTEISEPEYTGKKLYTEKQVSASAFFGGPLPAGILIYKNLIRLEKEKQAYIVLATTLILCAGLLFAIIATPENILNKIPNQLFPTIWGLLVLAIYHFQFAHLAKETLKSKQARESNWNVTGVTVFGTIVFLVLAIAIGMVEPAFPGKKMEFRGGNEIFYDETTSAKDVKKLSSQLFTSEFFDENYPGTARLETNPDSYSVTLLFNKDLWEDQDVLSDLVIIKWLLEAQYNTPVKLMLMDYALNGNEVYKIVEEN